MSKEIYISSTPHETRLAIVENDALTEIYYERENEYTLAGSIYNGRVTRVLPGMQSSFVDIGLERDAFLYITDFLEEAPDSTEFDTASNGDHPRGEGSDRGERRGRRNGRDRNERSERSFDRRETQQLDRTRGELPGAYADEAEPGAGESLEGETAGDVGVAPESGSRRWRGRRGRRRGRSSGQQEQQGYVEHTRSAGPEQRESGLEEETLIEGGSSFEDEGGFEFGAEAAETPRESFEGNGFERNEDPRKDRRAGRRDGRRDRRDERAPRYPRGFTPSREMYGVDTGERTGTGPIGNAYGAAEVEPIVLPGESLSKYRKGGEEPANPAAEPAAVAPPPPTTLYTFTKAWDGGETMPGETLSQRRPAEGRDDRRPEDRGGRRERRGREGRWAREEFAVATPAIEPQFEAPPAQEIAVQQAVAVGEPLPEAELQVTSQAETEYEPTEASVSYRVDVAAPSEYRQSAPVMEPSVEPIGSSAQAAEHQPASEANEAEEHDITAITPTGEMVSEPAEPLAEAPAHQPEPMEVAEPASPIQHEGAVRNEPHSMAEETFGGLTPATAAPVSETAEEQLTEQLDDAEPAHTIHASVYEELDDLDEEETLEGAADLGTMLREMSIDEITRTSPEITDEDLEEDDFEEGELAEDDELSEEQVGDQNGYEADGAAEAEEFEEEIAPYAAPRELADEGGERYARQAAPELDPNRSFREGERRGRRDRRDGRRGGRERRSGGMGDRGRGRSVQSTNLPAISDLLKPGQEILVQIAKEPIAKKGARITSHIALPGRFLVFMPTVNHTGVSRKIESDGERRRLKEILLSEKGDAAGGFIVRTAAAGASEDELRSDLRFLLNLWSDIKARSESSKSPALIYHDLNLVERVLRDQVTDNFSAIWVDSETEYERVLRFLQRFQPSLIRRVKLYLKETPLFEQFGITEEINKALRSKVWLKSGGSIVINQTEALVAIDINTGKYVGKTARLEDTIVKTNLDAIPEIVRQIRLRDLGGIIIIDFIDMDERKNRNRVMAALEEELKKDRAPSKVLQFNDFGLVAITRKRVKQSLERTLSTTCSVCTGTGMVKSPVTVCNDIYIEMRKMHKHLDRGDVMLRVHPDVVKQLKASGSKWLQEMEEMVGKTILVKSDPGLHPEQFDIH